MTEWNGGIEPGASGLSWACAERKASFRRSTVGRPRRLSDAQVVWLLKEYDRYRAWRALRPTVKSQRQLANELGVSQATISLATRLRGQYKQASRPP